MTIDDLIEELQEARETLGGQAQVRVAYQESYPLRGTVARVTVPDDADLLYDEGEAAPGQDQDGHMCWLAVGAAPYDENPYGPGWAWTGEYPEPEEDPDADYRAAVEHGQAVARGGSLR